MKKNISFQMRFLMVFTLLLLLALSFFVAQYSNTLNMEKQHVEQMKWEQFKTASSSISGLLSRCAAVVEDTPSINDCVYLDESGHVCIRDSKLQLLIEKMEERLNGIECVCTLRGSPDLYTSSGKISYSDYENVYKSEYDLNRSLFYSSLHGTTTQKVRCIYLQGTNITGAVVLMVSVSLLPASSTDMIFAFEINANSFTNALATYMGVFDGSFFVYNPTNIACILQQGDSTVSYSEMLHISGTGVQHFSLNNADCTMLRYINSDLNLAFALAQNDTVFYAQVNTLRNKYFQTMLFLFLSLLIIAICLTFFLYAPILRLYKAITNRTHASIRENELNAIMNAYTEMQSKKESLENRLSAWGHSAQNQFLMKLLFGKVTCHEEAMQKCCILGFNWKYDAYAALLILSPCDKNTDWNVAENICAYPDAILIPCEIWQENGLCYIINLSSQSAAQLKEIASALQNYYREAGYRNLQIGVGRFYKDITQLADSFAEASTAVQLADTAAAGIFFYDKRIEYRKENNIQASLQTGLSFVHEALEHSEAAVARRAIQEVTDIVSEYSESFLIFHYYASRIVAMLQEQFVQIGAPLSNQALESLLHFQTKNEFLDHIYQTIDALCLASDAQNEKAEQMLRNRLLSCIQENFTRFDFSLDYLTEQLNISTAHAVNALQETVGLTFSKYVATLRMEEFKRLLRCTNNTIGDSVRAVGYIDAPSFLRKFKSQEGLTPTQYREREQAKRL